MGSPSSLSTASPKGPHTPHPLFYAAMLSMLPGFLVLGDMLASWTRFEIFLWLPLFIGFVAFPVADLLLQPLIVKVFSFFERPTLASSDYRIVLFLGVILNTLALLYGFVIIRSYSLMSVGFWGVVMSMGSLSAAGTTWAHELIHKWTRWDQLFGMWQLAIVLYMQFRIEHLFSHHKHVATPLDAATARRGETIYNFVPRAIYGTTMHAWQIENQQLARNGLSTWSLQNSMLQYLAIYLALILVAFYIGGFKGVLYFVGQALMAIILTEIINYVEHYGLERELLPNGQYEPVGTQHSWDATHRLTGIILAHLPTHADHHMHSTKPYHMLTDIPEAPHLPAPYPSMVVVSLVPPLYYWIIHPLLDRQKSSNAKSAPQSQKQHQK